MTGFALRMLRHRPGSALATFLALAAGVMILVAMGGLVESGLRHRQAPVRYAAADVVVAHRDITVSVKEFDGEVTRSSVRLPEGGTVPAGLADRIRALPGVATVAADDPVPVVLPATSAAVTGHGWSSAALAPYRTVAGAAPAGDLEVAVDRRLGLTPGQDVRLLVAGTARTYRVSGVVDGPAAAVFFTDAHAATLSAHPGRVAAVGVVAAPGTDVAALAATVRAAAGDADVYTGADRGLVEESDELGARDLLVQAGAAFGGYVVLLIGFVVAATVGLSVRHRRRDLALLRAVAATPAQVRRMIMAEALLVSLAAAAAGVPAGILATRWVRDQLVGRGFVPAGFPISPGLVAPVAAVAVTTLVAVLSALVAARRVTAIRPVEALGEVAVEPPRSGRVRLVSGLVAAAGAVSSGTVTAGAGGQAALAGAVGMLYLFVTAVGLLAPWINRTAATVLAPVLRTVWGVSGYLATANLRANARGMAAVLTALVLSVGLGGSVWFLQDNLERQTVAQHRDGLLAQHALVSPAGLPPGAVEDARRTPGVRTATAVRRTAVVVRSLDGAETVGAQAVDTTDLGSTMDLRVRDGDLADLAAGTLAASSVRASTHGWHVGDPVECWLGDGTPVRLTLVAIYDRGLGFGDITLTRDTVAGHTARDLDDEILIRADATADLPALAARHPGSAVVATGGLTRGLAADLAVSAWLNRLLVGVMVGYAALAAANTMVIAALARRRELAVLRLAGVTRRQARRMVHAEQAGLLGVAVLLGAAVALVTLAMVVRSVTGEPVPYVPPLGGAAVLGGAALLALLTTVLPIGRLLRVPPVEHIGVKE
ncbi:FtsX-like permease family protein [Dactylosporangium aurantiacum]|uniref:FtsX-like permease family protein n=1 Tax=Dactylosporangium aurantiacum TaxID=35754 RepID=A0A9Q9I8W5_9ACTN|nr:FtsX-like permease family protein [Dactylosporangium aurantiacum]MDG6109527.1 FtsX-like permease family protein [Dactylosporangium aurantiacum]UWZ51316.1 FtsX-like permease family protein [Dactylosporangium aurantiacum]